MRVLRTCGTSVVLVQMLAGTCSGGAAGRAGRRSGGGDGGAWSAPVISGRGGSISGGFGVEAAGSGEIEASGAMALLEGPVQQERETEVRGDREEGGKGRGGGARRRCGVAGEAACGREGSSRRRELQAAARSGSGPGLEGFLCKIEPLSTL